MSLNFKNNLEEIGRNEAASQEVNAEQLASEYYDTPGNVRNLCFVWPDGRMKFMNYAYLISVEFDEKDASIKLEFTTTKLIIKGFNLRHLFEDLQGHLPKFIRCCDLRYQKTLLNNQSWITELISN